MERAFAQRALSASLVVAVAFVAVWGGRTVLWCPSMERAVSHCCCPAEDTPPSDGPAIARAACCEAKVFEAAPASSADARTPSAPIASAFECATLPPSTVGPAGALARTASSVAPGRGSTAPPKIALHLRNCVHLL